MHMIISKFLRKSILFYQSELSSFTPFISISRLLLIKKVQGGGGLFLGRPESIIFRQQLIVIKQKNLQKLFPLRYMFYVTYVTSQCMRHRYHWIIFLLRHKVIKFKNRRQILKNGSNWLKVISIKFCNIRTKRSRFCYANFVKYYLFYFR